ncbi:MAG: HAMP domain-containing sensor histidine kinase, partial [Burkholderiaceae bacterium]
VEQLRQQEGAPTSDLAAIVRAVVLDLSPLLAEKNLDFEIDSVPAMVRAHDWMLRELTRNLLHNAIKHAPAGSHLAARVALAQACAVLTVSDAGTGISEEQRNRLFQPFSAGNNHSGSGLGLAICQEIVLALGGSITLHNRIEGSRVTGLNAVVNLPLAGALTEEHGQAEN